MSFNDLMRRLSEQAAESLRLNSALEIKRGRRELQLLVRPSFEGCFAWDLFRVPEHRGSAERFVLCKTTWRREFDHQRLSGLNGPHPVGPAEPTFAAATFGMKPLDAEHILSQLRGLSAPLAIAEPHSGLDGTHFELAFGDQWVSARFHWWSQPPEEWAGLGRFFDEALAMFESIAAG